MDSLPRRKPLGRPRSEGFSEGTRFGRLTVESGPFWRLPRGRTVDFYRCRCDCGQITDVARGNLVSVKNGTISCGCWRRERLTTHGDSHSRLHNVWMCILQRCHNPNNPNYPDYGGRGITVCTEWREAYEPFRDWAMANGYADDLEIDREKNDGPYSPENCRFVTHAVQVKNTRRNNLLTAFSETKCITDWLKDPRCLVTGKSLRRRLKRWDAERAMTTPAARNPRKPHSNAD